MGGGEVLKKGWLVKSPPLEGGGMKSWRKRYFILRSSKILEYYKYENGDIKGVINLEDCVSVHADLFHKKYKHVFDIQTKERTYYLVASSTEDMNNWVATLCKVCEFTTQAVSNTVSRGSSTLPGNISVVKTPLPEPPTVSKFSPEVERYLLSPEVVELLRCKPKDPVPAGIPFQDAMVQKGLAGNHSRTFSHPHSSRTSTGSSSVSESPITSQRSSQDFSSRFSTTSSIDGHFDSNNSSFTYDSLPPSLNNNSSDQSLNGPIHVPSHYDVPRSSLGGSDRAQLLSNNYMVPRQARMSDPLIRYDPHYSRPKDGHYDYPPRRDNPLPLRSDLPLPPRSELPLPPRNIPYPGQQQGSNNSIYDVPPHPRPANGSQQELLSTPPLQLGTESSPRRQSSGTVDPWRRQSGQRQSIDTIDCPIDNHPPPPPSIIFRRDSKGMSLATAEEMIPNKMYEMVRATGGNDNYKIVSEEEDGILGDLEDTLKVDNSGSEDAPVRNKYVNLCTMEEEEEDMPPPVDRSLKPYGAGIHPPVVDRSNKPTHVEEYDGEEGEGSSLSQSLPSSSLHSLSQEAGGSEDIFVPKEIPRLTSNSVHYTQVSFDKQLKKPIPTPRSNCTPNASPQHRVNYTDININAITSSLNEMNHNSEEVTDEPTPSS